MKKFKIDWQWVAIIAWVLLLLGLLFFLPGCTEVEKKAPVDAPARQEIMRNRNQIIKNFRQIEKNMKDIKDLQDRDKTNYKESQGIHIQPIPVPIIPVPGDVVTPRLPPTKINKGKKFTLLGPLDPVPLPKPSFPYPRPIPC